MKKNILLSAFFFILIIRCWGQAYYNKWYITDHLFLDFNSGAPTFVHVDSAYWYAQTGHSSISDENGNLLFYTDGYAIRNAQHKVMPNGTLDAAISSISQSSLVIPDPANKNQYYLFTSSYMNWKLFYSIVDMKLDKGLGDLKKKNVQFCDGDMKGFTTAIRLSNGQGFWVIAHDKHNSFYAYKLTTAGLDTIPVISTIGASFETTYGIGHLKHNKKGDRLIITNHKLGMFEIFNFDQATGIVSGAISSPRNYYRIYGAEFSPDDNLVYISGGDSTGTFLYQINMKAGSPAAILNSATLIAKPVILGYPTGQIGALQIGPDCKIYAAKETMRGFGVINYPNVLGLGCTYVDDQVVIPKFSTERNDPRDLPNFFEMPCCAHKMDFLGNDTLLCPDQTTALNAGAGDSYLWSTGSTNSSILISDPGNYWVHVVAGECLRKDTIHVGDCYKDKIEIEFPNVFTPNNDGYNDIFVAIKFHGVENSSLKIYNRWGVELKNTTDISKGWDGTFDGSKCSPGTYFWILRYTTVKGELNYLKGAVTLLD